MKSITKVKSSETTISLFNIQAELLGIDVDEFHEKMKGIDVLATQYLIEGKQVHVPSLFYIKPVYRTVDNNRFMSNNKNIQSETTSRIFPHFILKRRFKDLLRNNQKKDHLDIF